jgi:hypothetical protein
MRIDSNCLTILPECPAFRDQPKRQALWPETRASRFIASPALRAQVGDNTQAAGTTGRHTADAVWRRTASETATRFRWLSIERRFAQTRRAAGETTCGFAGCR